MRWRIVHIVFLGIGGLLMTAANLPPADVISNLSQWAKYIGIEDLPNVLKSPFIDSYASWIGAAFLSIPIFFAARKYLGRHVAVAKPDKPVKQKYLGARDVLQHILGVRKRNGLEDEKMEDVQEALNRIREAAHEGKISVRGRKHAISDMGAFVGNTGIFRAIHTTIPETFWEANMFDLSGILSDEEEAETEAEDPSERIGVAGMIPDANGQRNQYACLQFDERQIQKLWPKDYAQAHRSTRPTIFDIDGQKIIGRWYGDTFVLGQPNSFVEDGALAFGKVQQTTVPCPHNVRTEIRFKLEVSDNGKRWQDEVDTVVIRKAGSLDHFSLQGGAGTIHVIVGQERRIEYLVELDPASRAAAKGEVTVWLTLSLISWTILSEDQ